MEVIITLVIAALLAVLIMAAVGSYEEKTVVPLEIPEEKRQVEPEEKPKELTDAQKKEIEAAVRSVLLIWWEQHKTFHEQVSVDKPKINDGILLVNGKKIFLDHLVSVSSKRHLEGGRLSCFGITNETQYILINKVNESVSFQEYGYYHYDYRRIYDYDITDLIRGHITSIGHDYLMPRPTATYPQLTLSMADGETHEIIVLPGELDEYLEKLERHTMKGRAA